MIPEPLRQERIWSNAGLLRCFHVLRLTALRKGRLNLYVVRTYGVGYASGPGTQNFIISCPVRIFPRLSHENSFEAASSACQLVIEVRYKAGGAETPCIRHGVLYGDTPYKTDLSSLTRLSALVRAVVAFTPSIKVTTRVGTGWPRERLEPLCRVCSVPALFGTDIES